MLNNEIILKLTDFKQQYPFFPPPPPIVISHGFGHSLGSAYTILTWEGCHVVAARWDWSHLESFLTHRPGVGADALSQAPTQASPCGLGFPTAWQLGSESECGMRSGWVQNDLYFVVTEGYFSIDF